MDRGIFAWRAAVYGVAQSRTWLTWLSSSSSTALLIMCGGRKLLFCSSECIYPPSGNYTSFFCENTIHPSLLGMCFSSPTDLWSRFNKLAGSVLLSQWLLRCDHKIQVRSTEKKRMKFRHFVSSARKQTIFSTGLRLMIWPENYWGPQCEN